MSSTWQGTSFSLQSSRGHNAVNLYQYEVVPAPQGLTTKEGHLIVAFLVTLVVGTQKVVAKTIEPITWEENHNGR